MFINLELYRIFYTTAKLGSISKAAKELYTSQPAVSQAIKQLEQKLGGELFYRDARGVSLTTEGEVLYRYIEQGYSLIQVGEQKFSELKQMTSGQLRLAVCSAVCKYDLLKYISQYNINYPDVSLYIEDESSYKIAQLLEIGKIDIGIINLYNIDNGNFNIIKTIEMHDCFVVGEKYKALCDDSISIHMLSQNYPLIMLQKGGNTRASIDEYFLSHGINLAPQIELSNLDLIIEFTVKGLGAACVIEEYVQKELKNKSLYKLNIQEKMSIRSLGIVTKKDMPLSTAARKFIEIMRT
ncbi:LysR family transcriptional regulator [Anaerocolumna sp. MB42-C2]|uniref:LysR family transcriptional regulator n=1 Tax=Anaerocolumna sp. MB42-C2 TaxID=3070997 RepID=UPI0027DF866B|nr:LysR family transcriptional regulator [Anaerocolumna sp. MB42-C2]WMJ87529.1 LysR family transcriptional regulator [Anaerocolumna sp. MB42-C2]